MIDPEVESLRAEVRTLRAEVASLREMVRAMYQLLEDGDTDYAFEDAPGGAEVGRYST